MAPCEKSVDDYCRLCAVEAKNGVVIYSSEGIHSCLEEKIIQCLRIEVSKDDMLPKKVCRTCRARLEEYHKFVERANKVQRTLELLIQMKLRTSPLTNSNSDVKIREVNVKLEDEVHIKDEIEDLPLDVTLESESDNHVEAKTAESSDEDQNVTDSLSSLVPPSKESKRNGDRPVRCIRRRKMLQPKRTSNPQAPISKRRGRPRRVTPRPPPSTSEEDSDDDDDEDDDDGDEDKVNEPVEEISVGKKMDSGHIDEVNAFKGLKEEDEEEEVEGEEEEEEEVEDEGEHKNIKEEWKTHWGIKCNECEQIFPFKSQFDKHYNNSYGKKPIYTCSYCNKTMEKYSTFRSHCYRHVTEGRYRCEYCQKGFSLRSMLHVHILAKHTTVKPFICEECGKGFVTRPGLNIHLKKHKTDEKMEYPCPDCGKILHTRGGLTAHQNVHKLGRRFMCDVCGKTFTQKVNMQQHVKHHTGERPFACEKCGKCFAEKSHLNRHYSFHSEKRPFQCKICLKMYKTERCLKVHAMVHSDARPYVCTYCNKGFLSTTKLKQHYNIHTGERPYACKYCERTFTNYPNWLKHSRRRHKADPKSGVVPARGILRQVHGHIQQQQQQQPPLPPAPQPVLEVHREEGRVSVNSQPPDTPPQQIPVVCLASNSMMAPYPHQTHQLQPQPHPAHQTQPPHPAHQAHHQSMQPTLPLAQVYPDHMMVMHMPHHHHMLPL